MTDPPPANEPRSPQDPPLVSIGAFDGLYRSGAVDPPRQVGSAGTLEEFTLVSQIGAGGMGIVFQATRQSTGERVAIKLLRPELVNSAQAVHRFVVEAGHMQRLNHPHILRVIELVKRPQGPYYVMPYAEGGPLSARLAPDRPLDLQTVLRIAREIGSALAFAHGTGIIHRDLKPANVLLDAQDNSFLSDFGLVRTVFNDSVIDGGRTDREGTPPYMSPGVAAGGAEDTRCDIYAFGALLYEMLANKPPYEGGSVDLIVRQVLAGPPRPLAEVNPRVPRRLVQIVEGCMARELRDRYAEMADALADLERFACGQAPRGARGHAGETRRWMVTAAGIVILGGAAWIVGRELPPRYKSPAPQTGVATTQKIATSAPTVAAATTVTVAVVAPTTAAAPTTLTAPTTSTRPTVSAIAAAWELLDPSTTEVHLDSAELVDADLAALERLTKLSVVDLKGRGITDAGLEHLKGLRSLHHVRLRHTSVTGTGLRHLRGMKDLEHLFLSDSPVVDASLAHLQSLPRLHYLYLDRTHVTDAGLATVGQLTQLSTLDISWLGITDAGLANLKSLTVLNGLSIGGAAGITDAGLKHLHGLTRLAFLDMRFTPLTGEGFAHLSGLTRLQDLNMGDTQFDDEGARNLPQLRELAHLKLAHTHVSSAGLESICQLKLAELNLCRTRVSDESVNEFAELKQLRSLDLSENAITDAGLEALGGLTQLTSLSLVQTKLTDVGLQHLRRLSNLRTLNLGNNAITRTGLIPLQDLPSLQFLSVPPALGTDEEVAALHDTFPNVKITH